MTFDLIFIFIRKVIKKLNTFKYSLLLVCRDEITLLAKDIYSKVDYDDGYRTINRFQLGAAYRDYDSNQLDMLAKLEYRLDDNATGDDPYQKDALVWSGHGVVITIQRVH